MTHEVDLVSRREYRKIGSGFSYRPVCTCQWKGTWTGVREAAISEGERHRKDPGA